MFRDRPLTWLFVVATVLIDLVLMTFESDSDVPSMIKLGLILGQVAALSIWSVRGDLHRLWRMTCLVVGTAILTFALRPGPEEISVWLAFHAMYVLSILFVTCVSDYARYRMRKKSGNADSPNPWRVPLIELFGWTIVVAIISFGARQMDFEFLDSDSISVVVSFITVPLAVAVLIRRDVRDLSILKAVVLVLLAISVSAYLASESEMGWVITFSQVSYLILWMTMLGLDEVQTRARTVRESLANEPQLLNPQE